MSFLLDISTSGSEEINFQNKSSSATVGWNGCLIGKFEPLHVANQQPPPVQLHAVQYC
jgi:hypothetical protein